MSATVPHPPPPAPGGPMRVAVLAQGDPATTASTRFRIMQFLDPWAGAGVRAQVFHGHGAVADLVAAGPHDAVVVQKRLLPAGELARVRAAGRRLVFDLDDGIWTRPGPPFSWPTRMRIAWRLRRICRTADLCVAANRVIADRLAGWGARVRVVGMALDLDAWRPAPRPADGRVVVGWAGAPGNLPFLADVAGALRDLAARDPRVRLRVLCGRDPASAGIAGADWTPWSPQAEIPFIQSLDIGILPLPDDPFARAKSPIKAIQYQACGVATAGDPVGATAELLADGRGVAVPPGGWPGTLARLVADPAARAAAGQRGRAAVERDHDRLRCAAAWLECLREP